MTIKVAVATSNGLNVDQHYGRAKGFDIYQLDGGEWRRVERRINLPACSNHSHSNDLLDQTAALLSDCQGVLINQIGPGAMDTLLYRKILPFTLTGSVADALETVLQSKLFRVRYKLT